MALFEGNGVCELCGQVALPLCFCPPGFHCDPGSASYPECERCPIGFYCPVAGDRVPPLPCPSGYFCPKNTLLPVQCQPGSLCSRSRQYFLVGPFLCLVLLAAILGWTWWSRRRSVKVSVSDGATNPPLARTDSARARRGSTRADELAVSIENVSLRVGRCGQRKLILTDVTGQFPAGSLTCVMGPSGSGKTTLLSVLRGSVRPTSGRVLVNGVKSNLSQFRRSIGYVPQDDDTVDPHLTVHEALMLSARLRLPRQQASRAAERVREVIDVLGLQHVVYQIIGGGEAHSGPRGISGGERKRVNIGLELVMQPACLLVDEPTSGLDSASAAVTMHYLGTIAAGGVTVISSIHAPSQRVFAGFDRLLLLAAGKVAYWGPANQAPSHFRAMGAPWLHTVAAPDAILDFLSDNPDLCVAQFAQARGSEAVRAQVTDRSALNQTLRDRNSPFLHTHLMWQLYRLLLRQVRQLPSFVAFLVMCGFSGLYLGLSFIDPKYVLPVPSSIAALCPEAVVDFTQGQRMNQPCATDWPSEEVQGLVGMYFCMGVGTIAAAISVRTLDNDKTIYWRETSSGMSAFASVTAKYLVDVVKIFCFSFFFISGYFLIASPFGAFMEYLTLTCAYIWVCFGLGYFASAVLSAQNAAIVAVLLSLTSGVLSGFVFQPSRPAWTFYFAEGLFKAELGYIVANAQGDDMDYVALYAREIYDYDIGPDVVHDCVVYMLLWGLGFRVLAAVLLRLRHWDKQK